MPHPPSRRRPAAWIAAPLLLAVFGFPSDGRATDVEGSTDFDLTLHVDAAADGPGDGSERRPFPTLTAAVERGVRVNLSAGRGVHLLVRPGRYDEGVPAVSGGIDADDRARSADPPLTDARLLIEPWADGDAGGEVVISGSDDWTDRPWEAVPGEPGLYRTDWDRNWGPWGGNAGSANVVNTAGQRREMVFLDVGDGRGFVRLPPTVLERYDYEKIADAGNPTTWVGTGKWSYAGFAGLRAIPPASFGVAELGGTDADAPATDGLRDGDGRDGVLELADGAGSRRATFREVFAADPHPHPNSLFVRLPPGLAIGDVRVRVSVRDVGWEFGDKRNLVLRGLTFEHQNPRLFSPGGLILGRRYFDWFLNTGNVLLEDVTVRDTNGCGLWAHGVHDATFRRCRLLGNGSEGCRAEFTARVRFDGCEIARNGWRSEALGGGSSFVAAGLKVWKSVDLAMTDCTVADNAYKGVYSDSTFQHGLFRGCRFLRNGVGAMHEIAAGPILYEDCLFEANGVGLRNEQAEGVTVRGCRFLNNTAAALNFVAKFREDGDTLRFATREFGPGDALNEGERVGLTVKDLTFERNTFATRVPGSRFVMRVSAASQMDPYLAGVVDGAAWRGNRYAALDPPFAFEVTGPYEDGGGRPKTTALFVDVARWAELTGEANDGPEPDVPGLAPPDGPYEPGFVWDRRAAWDRAGRDTAADTDGRPLRDRNGVIAWRARTTRDQSGDRLADPTPWYRTPPDDLTFPRLNEPGDPLTYAEGMIFPLVDRDGATGYSWEQIWNLGLPFVQWDNPTGRTVTLRADGDLTLRWLENTRDAVDVVVAVVRADGSEQRLLAETVTPPADGSLAWRFILSDLPPFTMGPDDRLVIAHKLGQSGHRQQTRLEDRLRLTLVAP